MVIYQNVLHYVSDCSARVSSGILLMSQTIQSGPDMNRIERLGG